MKMWNQVLTAQEGGGSSESNDAGVKGVAASGAQDREPVDSAVRDTVQPQRRSGSGSTTVKHEKRPASSDSDSEERETKPRPYKKRRRAMQEQNKQDEDCRYISRIYFAVA